MTSNSDNSNSLNVAGDSRPNVPVFVCLVYIRQNESGGVSGKVANLAGIEAIGSSERDVLSKVMQKFKPLVSQLYAAGQEIPWIDPPQPPQDSEQVRSIPMHL